jgi:cytochrome c553
MRCDVRFWIILLTALAVSSTFAQAGGDPLAGQKKIAKCVVCHGRDGIAKNPGAPNLAGQKADYLLRSFAAYKSGERKNEQMKVIVSSVTDADLADLIAYYAAIKITVEVPK